MENKNDANAGSTAESSEIFPMRMTSIEKLHWFDDDPDLPNLIFGRIRINEKIDEQCARQAWQIAVERQPFSDVKPEKIKGRWHWVRGARGDGQDDSRMENWHGTRFEWTEHASKPTPWRYRDHPVREKTGSYLGVRVWRELREVDGDRVLGSVSEIWFYVHHSIGDGAGAIQVINEWMQVYANLRSGRPPTAGLHRLNACLLKHRNQLNLLSWRYLKHVPKQPIALFGAAKFIFRKTAELIPGKTSSTCSYYPAIFGESISESGFLNLSEHALRHEVMLNTVLLGQLYLALDQWRSEQEGHSDRDWIRIILPMSIRNISDRRLPMANRATIVQVDRCGKDMQELGRFYRQLDREIKIIRGWQLDKMFLIAVRCLSVFEPRLRRAANNRKSRGMAVFTNLGSPFRKLDRELERGHRSEGLIRPEAVDFVGPVRRGTPINFSVARHQLGMRVSLHFDSRVLTDEQAQELLGCYIGRLKSIHPG